MRPTLLFLLFCLENTLNRLHLFNRRGRFIFFIFSRIMSALRAWVFQDLFWVESLALSDNTNPRPKAQNHTSEIQSEIGYHVIGYRKYPSPPNQTSQIQSEIGYHVIGYRKSPTPRCAYFG